MTMKSILAQVAIGTALAASAPALAQTTIPSFVGKGNVQSYYGSNNQVFQSYAPQVDFRFRQELSYEWDCYNPHNDTTREKASGERITATITTIGRDRNGRITGFIIAPGAMHDVVTGQAPGSCPSGWTAGTVDTIVEYSAFQISRVSNPNPSNLGWTDFPI